MHTILLFSSMVPYHIQWNCDRHLNFCCWLKGGCIYFARDICVCVASLSRPPCTEKKTLNLLYQFWLTLLSHVYNTYRLQQPSISIEFSPIQLGCGTIDWRNNINMKWIFAVLVAVQLLVVFIFCILYFYFEHIHKKHFCLVRLRCPSNWNCSFKPSNTWNTWNTWNTSNTS